MEAQKQLQKMIRMEKITSEASEISNTWRRWLGWQGGSFESFSTWTSPSPVGERKDHGQHARQRQGRVSKEGEQSYKWNRQTKNMKSLRTFLLTRLIQIRWQRVNWWAVSPVWLFFLLYREPWKPLCSPAPPVWQSQEHLLRWERQTRCRRASPGWSSKEILR